MYNVNIVRRKFNNLINYLIQQDIFSPQIRYDTISVSAQGRIHQTKRKIPISFCEQPREFFRC